MRITRPVLFSILTISFLMSTSPLYVKAAVAPVTVQLTPSTPANTTVASAPSVSSVIAAVPGAMTTPTGASAATSSFSETPDMKIVSSGVYNLDPAHASITFKVLHLGFSHYTGRFDKIEGTLNFNNQTPDQSTLDVTVNVASIDTNNAKLEDELRNNQWFNVPMFPTAAFHATKIERTSATTGKITGDFTLMGVTKPITLDTTLVGFGLHPLNKKPVLGFSATTIIKRSAFGFMNYIPMISDDVTLQIEAEFDKAE